MDCRGRCGHWQACFDAFVMCFPKTDSSLFVVFFPKLMYVHVPVDEDFADNYP